MIFSTDITSFYPSLDIPFVCAAVAEEIFRSDLQVTVDIREIALYLAIVYDRQHLRTLGLGDVTHTRVASTGRKPGITTPEIIARQGDTVCRACQTSNRAGAETDVGHGSGEADEGVAGESPLHLQWRDQTTVQRRSYRRQRDGRHRDSVHADLDEEAAGKARQQQPNLNMKQVFVDDGIHPGGRP